MSRWPLRRRSDYVGSKADETRSSLSFAELIRLYLVKYTQIVEIRVELQAMNAKTPV